MPNVRFYLPKMRAHAHQTVQKKDEKDTHLCVGELLLGTGEWELVNNTLGDAAENVLNALMLSVNAPIQLILQTAHGVDESLRHRQLEAPVRGLEAGNGGHVLGHWPMQPLETVMFYFIFTGISGISYNENV